MPAAVALDAGPALSALISRFTGSAKPSPGSPGLGPQAPQLLVADPSSAEGLRNLQVGGLPPGPAFPERFP